MINHTLGFRVLGTKRNLSNEVFWVAFKELKLTYYKKEAL